MYATRSWYFNEHNYMFLYRELHSLTEIGVFGTRKYLNKIWGVEGEICLMCQQIIEKAKAFILTQYCCENLVCESYILYYLPDDYSRIWNSGVNLCFLYQIFLHLKNL